MMSLNLKAALLSLLLLGCALGAWQLAAAPPGVAAGPAAAAKSAADD